MRNNAYNCKNIPHMIIFDAPDNRCYITGMEDINVVGYQKTGPGEPYPKPGFPDIALFKDENGRCINSYQLIYIASGSGIFRDRLIQYEVRAGQFILIQPGFWHFYTPNPKTGWEEYYIGFNGAVFSALAREIFEKAERSLISLKEPFQTKVMFNKALDIARDNPQDKCLLLNMLLSHLMVEIRFLTDEANVSRSTLVFKTRKYMEEHLSEKIRLEDIASHLGVSYPWFRLEFTKEMGMPPATLLRKIRLQKAKYHLLSSQKPVKEIAVLCGFSTSEYFCIFFKESTGMTPSEYRGYDTHTHLNTRQIDTAVKHASDS